MKELPNVKRKFIISNRNMLPNCVSHLETQTSCACYVGI